MLQTIFLPEGESLNIIQPTAGPGGMKGLGDRPFAVPSFLMGVAGKRSAAALGSGHLLHTQNWVIPM